jgi:hypothetical protein
VHRRVQHRAGSARVGPAGRADNLRAGPTRPRTVPEYHGDGLPTPALTGAAPWVRADAAGSLTFQTTGPGERRELVPLHRLFDERYAVYFKVPAP